MILEHDGIEVDFFDKFPRDLHKVGIFLSGGADSALILYLLVKMADERNQELKIYPINGFEVTSPDCDSEKAAKSIIEFIRNNTSTDRIHDLYVHPMIQESKHKYYYIKPALLYLRKKYNFYEFILGTSQGMPGDERPTIHEGTITGNNLIETSEKYDDVLLPWARVNKKFIAAQYNKLGLKKLSDITNSCIVNSSTPCKECWWCKERYWAFGSYDGGLQ